ncbi:MAG: DUF4190 domain-containing protein [Acidimicrobiales bacterium]
MSVPAAPGGQPEWAPPQPPASSGRTNGMAVASLVCGILGLVLPFVFLPAILALVFGYVGRRQIADRGEAGQGMATAGIVLGWVGLVLTVLAVIFIVAALSSMTFG